jgi:hypothetical protein
MKGDPSDSIPDGFKRIERLHGELEMETTNAG